MKETKVITVIICTYNRPKLFKSAIASLLNQTLDRSKFEIIVVDNSSDRQTYRIVKSYKSKRELLEIRYIHESIAGLSRARNIGFKNATGLLVTYLDDDARVDADWLEKIVKNFQGLDKAVIAIGGQIIPYYEDRKPPWFKDEYETDNKGSIPRFLKSNESFSGSNMIWKKKYLVKYGGFVENLGMRKTEISLGEETDLFERIWENNKNAEIFYYLPELKVYHLVDKRKMSISYRLKRWFAYGKSLSMRSRNKNFLTRILTSIKVLIYFIVSLFSAPLLLFKYRYLENWLVERIGPLQFCRGYFNSLIHGR